MKEGERYLRAKSVARVSIKGMLQRKWNLPFHLPRHRVTRSPQHPSETAHELGTGDGHGGVGVTGDGDRATPRGDGLS